MGLSETIVASIIGAAATVITAIFQLVRNRAPNDSKPKKNRVRSLLATVALGIACVVGGYAWSSLRAVSAKQELQATMKAEFAEQFAALARSQKDEAEAERAAARTAAHGPVGSAESLAQLPPCRLNEHPDEVGPVTCSDRAAQTIALCATVPAAAQTTQVRVLARVPRSESPWLERDAGAATLGSLHIGEATTEHPVSPEARSVCLDVANWSVEDTLAVRVVVDYAFAAQPTELTAATPAAASL